MGLDMPSLYVAGGYKVAKRLRAALRHSLLAELQALFPDRHAPASGERVDHPRCLEELHIHVMSHCRG